MGGEEIQIDRFARRFPTYRFRAVFAETERAAVVITPSAAGQSKPFDLLTRNKFRIFFSACLLSSTKRVVASNEPQPPAALRYGLMDGLNFIACSAGE